MIKMKPIIKWAGGKSQIKDKIIDLFPKCIDQYHEIFVGGGSILFGVLERVRNKDMIVNEFYAYDLNKTLIYLYKNIQKFPQEVYDEIENLKSKYLNILNLKGNKNPQHLEDALTSRESFYYWTRKQYNNFSNIDKCSIRGTAYFIFLNKTCFRGLYRIGPNGFNVPYGNYKNPSIIDKEHLIELCNLIQNVNFIHQDFSQSLSQPQHKNNFIYLDPPYVPLNKNSFTKYNSMDFNLDIHKKLFSMCKQLDIKFIMSNSNTSFVLDEFRDYKIIYIDVKRRINSKNPNSMIKEVVIISL